MRMVEFAEAEMPSVGIVRSYQLSGNHIRWEDSPYPEGRVFGHGICRKILWAMTMNLVLDVRPHFCIEQILLKIATPFTPIPHHIRILAPALGNWRILTSDSFIKCFHTRRVHADTRKLPTSDSINRTSSANLNDLIKYGPLLSE